VTGAHTLRMCRGSLEARARVEEEDGGGVGIGNGQAWPWPRAPPHPLHAPCHREQGKKIRGLGRVEVVRQTEAPLPVSREVKWDGAEAEHRGCVGRKNYSERSEPLTGGNKGAGGVGETRGQEWGNKGAGGVGEGKKRGEGARG